MLRRGGLRAHAYLEGLEGTDDERVFMYPCYYVPQSHGHTDAFAPEPRTRGAANVYATEKVSGTLHLDVLPKTAPKTPPGQAGDGVEPANIQPNGAAERGGGSW